MAEPINAITIIFRLALYESSCWRGSFIIAVLSCQPLIHHSSLPGFRNTSLLVVDIGTRSRAFLAGRLCRRERDAGTMNRTGIRPSALSKAQERVHPVRLRSSRAPGCYGYPRSGQYACLLWRAQRPWRVHCRCRIRRDFSQPPKRPALPIASCEPVLAATTGGGYIVLREWAAAGCGQCLAGARIGSRNQAGGYCHVRDVVKKLGVRQN